MISFVHLSLIVAGVVALVVISVLAVPLLTTPKGGKRCERCGHSIPVEARECPMCEAPFRTGLEEGEPLDTVRDDEDGEPKRVHVDVPSPAEDGSVINPGVPRGLIKVAAVVMFIGLGTRVLGMLEPAGLSLGIPYALTAVLTVVGGVAMFAGFIVLDIA